MSDRPPEDATEGEAETWCQRHDCRERRSARGQAFGRYVSAHVATQRTFELAGGERPRGIREDVWVDPLYEPVPASELEEKFLRYRRRLRGDPPTTYEDLPTGLQGCVDMLASRGFDVEFREYELFPAKSDPYVPVAGFCATHDDVIIGVKQSTGTWEVRMLDDDRDVYEMWAYPSRVHDEIRTWLDEAGDSS